MPLEVIYVIRHGFRPAFAVDAATGTYTAAIRSPTGIPNDPPLTSYGVEQANELAEHLLKLDPPIDQIYSSPFYRCLQTILPFVERRNSPATAAAGPTSISGPGRAATTRIRVEKGVGEWMGHAPWDHPAAAPMDRLQELFPGGTIDDGYASRVIPPRNGETLSQLHERVASAVDAIIEQCDREGGEGEEGISSGGGRPGGSRSILLCTHAAVVIALGRVLTGQMPDSVDVEDFQAFTCGLSVYRRRQRPEVGNGPAVAEFQRQGQRQHAQPHPQQQKKDLPRDADDHSMQWRALRSETEAGTQSTGTVGPRPPLRHGRRTSRPEWKGGIGVQGGWTCVTDSDCSFLSGGPERGWRFSGDESFSSIGSHTMAGSGAGFGVDVAGGGEGHDRAGTGPSKL